MTPAARSEDLDRLMAAVKKIASIENLSKDHRLAWQSKAIDKIISFSRERSAFWRARTADYNFDDISSFTNIPVLNRVSVREQIESENSLVSPDKDKVLIGWHETGGSSGNPLKFLVTKENVSFNVLRGFSQYIIERSDISLDRMNAVIEKGECGKFGFDLICNQNWGGHFRTFRTGKSTTFKMYNNFNADQYLEKLKEIGVNGYFSSNPRSSRVIASALVSNEFPFASLNVKSFMNRGDKINPVIRAYLEKSEIPIKNTYSCEEIGPIGFSCPLDHEIYHVAATNVMVEAEETPGMDGKRLLVTGLNSFATPFIRYDIGDIGEVQEGCACGWRGQVISGLQGRRTNAVRFIDGSIKFCHLEATNFTDLRIDDIRMRQHEYGKIDVEYVRAHDLSPQEQSELRQKIASAISADLDIRINKVTKIAWGTSYKRHFFRCEI